VLLQLRDANARILTGAPVVSIEGDTILCRSGQSTVSPPLACVVATHSWIVVKEAGAAQYSRFDYTAWGEPI
jgi:hypothetical protein